MATSDNHGTAHRPDGMTAGIGDLTHYDLVLAVIPTAFVVSLLVAHLLSVSTQVAFAGAAFVGLLAVVDGLFVHPPRDSR